MGRRLLSSKEVNDAAQSLLNLILCKFSYGQPRNVDKVSIALRKKAKEYTDDCRSGRFA